MQPEDRIERGRIRIAHQTSDVIVNYVVRETLQKPVSAAEVTESGHGSSEPWVRPHRRHAERGVQQRTQADVPNWELGRFCRHFSAGREERVRGGPRKKCARELARIRVLRVAIVPIREGPACRPAKLHDRRRNDLFEAGKVATVPGKKVPALMLASVPKPLLFRI